MKFCLPPTGLETEFPPMIDWAHPNSLNSTDANRPRQADDEAEEFEESIFRQIPPDTHDPLSLDAIPGPSQLSLDPYGTATTTNHDLDVGKAVTPSPNSDNPHDTHDEDDDATTKTPNARDCSDSVSKHSLPVVAAPKEGPANKRRRSATGPSTEETRAKNRLAASKCRRKKKVEERGLEERQRRLSLQRAILREAAGALVQEVLALKHEVLRHAACGFTPLDHYIADAAARGSASSSLSTSS